MKYLEITNNNSRQTIQLNRGKVNAINEALVEELHEALKAAKKDDRVRSIILTGSGAFFSFGFDIPELYAYSPEDFTRFLTKFTDMNNYLFGFPKPVVAAINGHAIAGGCMLACACDYRLMVTGKAKISLNELTFGSSVFQGGVEMLRFWVGSRYAQEVLYSGKMHTAETARGMDLVDEVVSPDELLNRAIKIADVHAEKNPPAFAHIKRMLRQPVLDIIDAHEKNTIEEFVKIWYSDELRAKLKEIKIRD